MHQSSNNVNWRQFSLDDRLKIRKEYGAIWDELVKGERWDVYSIWPYDWIWYMSPIERNVWSDIRFHGLSFYPQVPIGDYFVDFADLQHKIVIEVDGEAYHQDTKKDEKRDANLKEMGYTVYRIRGRDSYANYDEEDDHGFWDGNSSDALLARLRHEQL